MIFSRLRRRKADLRDVVRVKPPPYAPVQVQIMGPQSLDIVNARDISARGLGVWIPHGFDPVALESSLELVITLPGESSFLARGVLRHFADRPNGYFGVELVDLDEKLRDRIRAYVDRHLDSR